MLKGKIGILKYRHKRWNLFICCYRIIFI